MTAAPTCGIVVLGIGSLIHGDDGLGVHAIELLRRDPRIPEGVRLIDGGTSSLELLVDISDSTHLLLLDAVDVGEAPGALIRMGGKELKGLPGAASVHQIGLADLLATLPLVSTRPREIVLLGVQPLTTDWGTSLSTKVNAAMRLLVDAVVQQLHVWTEEPLAAPLACCEREPLSRRRCDFCDERNA